MFLPGRYGAGHVVISEFDGPFFVEQVFLAIASWLLALSVRVLACSVMSILARFIVRLLLLVHIVVWFIVHRLVDRLLYIWAVTCVNRLIADRLVMVLPAVNRLVVYICTHRLLMLAILQLMERFLELVAV